MYLQLQWSLKHKYISKHLSEINKKCIAGKNKWLQILEACFALCVRKIIYEGNTILKLELAKQGYTVCKQTGEVGLFGQVPANFIDSK